MRISKFLMAIIVFILFSGCSVPASKTIEKEEAKTPKIDQKVKAPDGSLKIGDEKGTGDNKPEKIEDDKVKNDPVTTVEPSKEPDNGTKPSPQPEPRLTKGEKLDFEGLSKLDNTRYAWWITMNSEHKTPGIPKVAGKLLADHNGIYIGDVTKKVVYLTFDEGYENGYTPKILDTLKENDTKALFFVTGPYIRQQTELVKRMLDEGHQVGNHSINHPSLPAVTLPVLENELWGLEKDFTAKYNKGFKYMRPPRGEYSERTMAAANQLGYKTVFWSFAYRDFETNNQKGADYAYNMVMKNLHNGSILLLHAVSKDNAEALDRIIKDIKAQGYEIRPFDL